MNGPGTAPDSGLGEETEDVRVGVYVCHCGGNISDVVDVKELAALSAEYPHVVVAKDYPFMCSDPGQALIVEDIKAHGVNRVVVASCAPALHEQTFRRALQRGGLNPYLYEHVNIREQVSWVHKADHAAATRKSLALVRAGIEKVVRQDPLEALRVSAERRVAVIGGGVAGMKAALAAAGAGLAVTLFEKGPALGGRLPELGRVFPTEDEGAALSRRMEEEVRSQPAIEVRLGAEVRRVDGFVGRFSVEAGDGPPVKAGALIVATGYDPYAPAPGEFGAGGPLTVTLPEFRAALEGLTEGPLLTWKGRPIRDLAFIHCVGSRQVEGIHAPQADGKVNDYCSRVCCTATLQTAERVLDRHPGTRVYDCYRDIRTYGRGHEAIYERAARKGTLFFRYREDAPPTLVEEGGRARLRVKDVLTWDTEVDLPVDLVVLATGMVPRDIGALADSQKLPRGADRFLQEAHPKLRPVELANNGIFLAGTAQAPMTVDEACAAAGAAASKAAQLLLPGEIQLDPFIVALKPERCDGCGACLDACSYTGSLTLSGEGPGRRVEVNPALCKGCGACVAVCPTRALDIAGWGLDQFEAMADAIAAV